MVVEKILRYDLPARFKSENHIDLEMLYGIYSSEYGQIVEYSTLARDIGISTGRQEIDFIFHVQDIAFPVECKTGRLRSNDTRLIRSLAEKWGVPFAVMITSETFHLFRPIDPARAGLYAVREKELPMETSSICFHKKMGIRGQ